MLTRNAVGEFGSEVLDCHDRWDDDVEPPYNICVYETRALAPFVLFEMRGRRVEAPMYEDVVFRFAAWDKTTYVWLLFTFVKIRRSSMIT